MGERGRLNDEETLTMDSLLDYVTIGRMRAVSDA